MDVTITRNGKSKKYSGQLCELFMVADIPTKGAVVMIQKDADDYRSISVVGTNHVSITFRRAPYTWGSLLFELSNRGYL